MPVGYVLVKLSDAMWCGCQDKVCEGDSEVGLMMVGSKADLYWRGEGSRSEIVVGEPKPCQGRTNLNCPS